MRVDQAACVSALVSDALPCADVLCARIEGERFKPSVWRTILENMKNLQALAVEGDRDPSHFLLELGAGSDPARNPAPWASAGHVVPNLTELWLYEACLDADVLGQWYHVGPYCGIYKPDVLKEGLKWVLMERARVHLPLGCLCLVRCSGIG